MPSPKLVAITGPLAGSTYELEAAALPFTIGRHSASSLQLRDSAVSRQQCELVETRDHFSLRDLGSRHGTFVNGHAVSTHRLEDGDYLRIGGSLFRFLLGRDGDSTPGSAPAPMNPTGWPAADSTVQMPVGSTSQGLPDRLLLALGSGAESQRRLQALIELSTGIQTLEDSASVCRRLAEWLTSLVPAQRTCVFLEDRWNGELELVYQADGQGLRETDPATLQRVLAEGQAVLATDLQARCPGPSPVAFLAAPLPAPAATGEETLGVVYLDRWEPPNTFDEGHLRLISAAASIAALALASTRRLEALKRENQRLRQAELDHDMVGQSPAFQKMLKFIGRVAPTDSTVLLRGESGSGKELVSMALHRNSRRADGPFIALNCATLSETLLESELFGHEKGSFTGAVARKEGKLELAHGGTLFLDELGEIPIGLQAKLLRALETRQFERVGGNRPIRVDIRLVAATHRDLETAIQEGTFRQDLYFRLNVITLNLPPLRDRGEDIPLLARHFLDHFSTRLGQPKTGLSPAARQALLAYSWPGNIRELANAIERAVVLGEREEVELEDLPEALADCCASEAPEASFHEQVAEAKRRLILDAVAAADGNLTRAAEQLSLNPTYLHRLITNLDLRDRLTG